MSTPTTRAGWLRGALVGACSAMVTAVAHAGGGGEPPQGGALVMLIAVCATVGAAVAGIALEGRHTRVALVVATLCVGQLLSHATLALAGGHHLHGGLGLTAPMLAAHAATAAALGVLISAVEYLYVVAASVLSWLRLFATGSHRPAARVAVPQTVNPIVLQNFLRLSGLGMRAPPLPIGG